MIKGFWHIYMINHWYSIVIDQMRILLTSGLYDACNEINIGCIGPETEKNELKRCFIDLYPKLKIGYYGEDPEVYEFPTIQLIENSINCDYVGFYFHTKGVTKPGETAINHWRAWLNESILNRWEPHMFHVLHGYDASGVNYLQDPDHYSGNYWWFDRNYIDRLPKIETLDHKNRYHAEQWICMYPKKNIFKGEFKEAGEDVFVIKHKK